MTNGKVYQGFCDDKKVEEHCIVLSNVVTPTRKSLEFKHASQ